MQLFIDSADPKQIKHVWKWGIIDGVTTNPSLASRVGKPYKEIVREILTIVDGPVSLEVVATDLEGMLDQARALAKLKDNVVVKLPCTTAGLQATTILKREGISTNMTLVFSIAQGLSAAKVDSDYCSPFVGRLDDISEHSGDELIGDLRQVYDNYGFETKILAASIRDVAHLEEVAKLGADVATVPFEVLQEMNDHPLTQAGLDRFLRDWHQAGLKLPV